jgi:hypothetical protein
MIRVFLVESTASLRAKPTGDPVIEVADLSALKQRLRESSTRKLFDEDETKALEHAIETLDHDAAADIMIACAGRVFRVLARGRPEPEAAPIVGPVATIQWLATDRESPVLLAGEEDGKIDVLRDGFKFLGYAADAVVVPEGDAGVLFDALRSRRPAALVLSEKVFQTCGKEIVQVARDGPPVAIVAILRRRSSDLLAIPPGFDGVLDHPVRLEVVASLLDPLLARVRQPRAGGSTLPPR